MQALRLIAVPLGLVLAGCGSNGWQDPEAPESQMPEPEPELQPVAVALVSGSGQEGLAGGSLDQPFVVRVTDAAGRPVPGVPVEWTTDLSVGEGFFCFDTPDQCHLPGYSVNTDAQGHSRVWFHPHATRRAQRLRKGHGAARLSGDFHRGSYRRAGLVRPDLGLHR
jgi:hypothetical protein